MQYSKRVWGGRGGGTRRNNAFLEKIKQSREQCDKLEIKQRESTAPTRSSNRLSVNRDYNIRCGNPTPNLTRRGTVGRRGRTTNYLKARRNSGCDFFFFKSCLDSPAIGFCFWRWNLITASPWRSSITHCHSYRCANCSWWIKNERDLKRNVWAIFLSMMQRKTDGS